MNKLIIGILVGLGLAMPVTAFAAIGGLRDAKDIYQFNCHASQASPCNRVAVFDDSDNKCYVSFDTNGRQSSISCVKR